MTNGAEFSALEVANLRNVSRSTVYRWIRAGKLVARKNSLGRWVITLPMPVIEIAVPEVVAVTAVTVTAAPERRSLWGYRRQLHGF